MSCADYWIAGGRDGPDPAVPVPAAPARRAHEPRGPVAVRAGGPVRARARVLVPAAVDVDLRGPGGRSRGAVPGAGRDLRLPDRRRPGRGRLAGGGAGSALRADR